jgi:methionine-rich copper-binding protein CopC
MNPLVFLRRTVVTLLACMVVVGVLIVGARPAHAHSDLVAAEPAPNSIVGAAVSSVTLQFSAPFLFIAPGVTITNTGGQVIPSTPRIDGNRALVTPTAPLTAGTYDVTWNIRADDGHESTGAYSFSIAASVTAPATVTTAGAPVPSSTVAPVTVPTSSTTTTQPTTTSTAPPSSKDDRARNPFALGIYALVAAVVVAIGALVGGITALVRRSRRSRRSS